MKQDLADAFPEYQSFVTASKSHKHPLAMISLVLKADQLASFANNKFLDWEARTELEGRIQVLEVGGVASKNAEPDGGSRRMGFSGGE